MTNTQLRHHPYKRPELRKILETLVRPSLYREVDSTTRRLVERNLRGSWCAGLRALDDRRLLGEMNAGSTLSVDAVAVAEEGGDGSVGLTSPGKTTSRRRRAPSRPDKPSQTALMNRRRSLDDGPGPVTSHSTGSTDYPDSPMTQSVGEFGQSGGGGLGLRMDEKQAIVDQVAQTSIEGSAPETVKASYDRWNIPRDQQQQDYEETVFAASPTEENFLSLPPSIPSIEAGHDLLDPIAQRHLTASNLHVSSSSSSNRTLVPRSLSATHPPLESFDYSSATNAPHFNARPRSTSLSVHSTHSSKHFYPDEDAPPVPPSPLSSSGELPLNASTRRRRPPPPPDAILSSSANSSRPRTPVSVGESSEGGGGGGGGSPKQGARRRPPPPPSSTASPRTGLNSGFEGLRVA